MATIRDVAKLANVSIASVSRIMNGDQSYQTTEKTKQAVLAAIRELNYQPSPSYTKHRKKPLKKSIGCITNLTRERYKDSYYTAILEGVERQLARFDCGLAFIKSQFDLDSESGIEELLSSSNAPKGIILMSTPSREIYERLRRSVPHIVGVDTQYADIDNVRYNRFEAGCIAMQYLLDCGHRDIGYIGTIDPKPDKLKFGRFDAYQFMLQKNRIPYRPDWVIDCQWQQQICFDKTVEVLRGDRPSAFFAASDHMAIASMSAMFRERLVVPEDISIASISDIPEAKYFNPPLTTVSIPQLEMGELAAAALMERMNGDNSIPKQIFVPTRLSVRDSVKTLDKIH